MPQLGLLCTHTLSDTGDDLKDGTRHLPAGADVRGTTAVHVTDPADVEGGSHFTDHDLRRDMCIHCHDNADHPGLANTQQQIRALCWFPRMRSYVEDHVDTCAYCLGKRKAAPHGAVRARRRLKLIEFDHKILSAEVVAATGCTAVLTVVDPASRVTSFVPVSDETAVTTARALSTRWYPLFGVPAVFRMDGAPHSATIGPSGLPAAISQI